MDSVWISQRVFAWNPEVSNARETISYDRNHLPESAGAVDLRWITRVVGWSNEWGANVRRDGGWLGWVHHLVCAHCIVAGFSRHCASQSGAI